MALKKAELAADNADLKGAVDLLSLLLGYLFDNLHESNGGGHLYKTALEEVAARYAAAVGKANVSAGTLKWLRDAKAVPPNADARRGAVVDHGKAVNGYLPKKKRKVG